MICSLFFGSFVFADSGEEFSSPTAQIYSVSYDAAELRQQAELLASASTTYTVDDIYNILLTIFSSGNGSVIPVLQNMALNINGTYTTQYAMSMRDYLEAISGASLYGSGQNALYYGATGQTIADFQFVLASLMGKHFSTDDGLYIDRMLSSVVNTLNTINSRSLSLVNNTDLGNVHLNNIVSNTSAISSKLSGLESLSWRSADASYNLYTGNVGSAYTGPVEYTVTLTSPNIQNLRMAFTRIRLPIRANSYASTLDDLEVHLNFFSYILQTKYVTHYVGNGYIDFIIQCPQTMSTYPIGLFFTLNNFTIQTGTDNFKVDYLLYDDLDYHWLNISEKANTIASNLEILVPDKAHQTAKKASESVTNQALDDFTGSGSGATKGSDVSSMKNISGSIQNGLSSGVPVSGATGAFDSNSGFWGWFSQENSNNINSPYPVPVLNNQRSDKKSASSDDIIDFLSPKNEELKRVLGGLEW